MLPANRQTSPFFAALAGLCAWLILLCAFCPPALADDWRATIHEEGAPMHLVGVDKKNHTFNFFEKKSPLRLRYSYPCVTGQIRGDKQQINDLRTPEGIYFVEYKISSGLDFREYGGVAYTLNYPNPVDRLRGKTGHGIWIHSKGFELVPTRGCVAIGREDIAEIGPMLTPGTPVVLAEELEQSRSGDNDEPDRLRQLMRQWSSTWAQKSSALFDYYDPEAYSRATENFDLFRQNKERLFKIINYIKIFNREIHVLEGPGYWVTWAEQLYTASNLSTEGVRRLYWQKAPNGDFKIVGMEWIPRDVGMRADFQKGRLVAEGPLVQASDASSESPQAPRLDMPEQEGDSEAASGRTLGKAISDSIYSITEKLVAVSEPLVPKKMPKTAPPDEIVWGQGRKLNETAEQPAQTATPQLVLPARESRPAPAKNQETNASGAQPAAEPEAPQKPEEKPAPAQTEPATEQVRAALNAWEGSYKQREQKLLDFYDSKKFNRLPASLGIARKQSLNSTKRLLQNDLGQAWLYVAMRPAKIEEKGPVVACEFEQIVASPQGIRQGVQKLWWQKDDAGDYKIVGSDFQPAALGLEADYLEYVSNDIYRMLEAWRKAWEGARLDDYMSFYSPRAVQQGRSGEKNIRRQKEQLWARVRPTSVQLSGLRLFLDKNGIRADMEQSYADNSGKKDKGIKTLLLKYDGSNWLIEREDWVAAD